MPLIGRRVPNIQHLEVEALEHTPNVRMIVDADHHPALAAPHEVGHPLVVLKRKVDSIAGSLTVRWVHVVERVRTVVALGAVKPGEIFDVGACFVLAAGRENIYTLHPLRSSD